MEILGHSRISVALEVYTHVDQDSHRDALKRPGFDAPLSLCVRPG